MATAEEEEALSAAAAAAARAEREATHEALAEARDPDHPTPYAAHEIPAPGAEDVGPGVTLVPGPILNDPLDPKSPLHWDAYTTRAALALGIRVVDQTLDDDDDYASAGEMAEQLIAKYDPGDLHKIERYIRDHRLNPDRTAVERRIAMGSIQMPGLHGPLGKTAALKAYREKSTPQDYSYRVEAVTKDGRRWTSGVRLATREEAEAYITGHARFELEAEGYSTAEIIKSDDAPANAITRSRKGGRPALNFEHGTCGSLQWVETATTSSEIEPEPVTS